jgi:hypothetical protein
MSGPPAKWSSTVAVTLLVAVVSAALPPRVAVADDRQARVDAALARAATYLAERQDRDGAWRSGIHGSFRDGPSLTPHVLSALYFLRTNRPAIGASFDHGAEYLRAMTRTPHRDPTPPRPLTFPVYTAAEASWVTVLGDPSPAAREDQRLWLDVLRQRQMNASLGWSRDDPHFGGWGYSADIPRTPAGARVADQPHANLSATLYALGALRLGDARLDRRVFEDALVFIDRCQNYCDDPANRDERFDDGGFFFAPDDPAGNKAGVAGTDAQGRRRLHSYGSMTCDGIRAMLACGRPLNHPRVVAARRWLERNFTVKTNPGTFAADRKPLRDGAYFYYCWSVAHAMQRLGVSTIPTPAGEVDWAEALADELLARQRSDGAWLSEISDSREDEPLVATPFAASALLICRTRMIRPPPSTLPSHSSR